jgi:alpha-beta hydrolase superfamily lysophospholipase
MRTVPTLGLVAWCALLGTAGCGAPPQTAPEPALHPDAPSYVDALLQIGLRQRQDDSVVVPGGRTVLMSHGSRAPRVYVLLHGFTDAPTQFETVGAHLFADGANVYIPRLPHHAERVAPLRAIGRVKGDELARFADSTAEIARGLGDTIIVVGLSAGGVLAGWMAEYHPEVQRTVLIAPAIAPGHLPDGEGQGIVVLASKLPDVVHMQAPIDTSRPENIPGITTRGLAELLRLGRRVYDDAERAPPVVHDIVFLLNEADRTVSESASIDLAQRWMDRGANVGAYRFSATAKLPHNLMELTSHGGNTALVYPVVEALARGGTVNSPETIELLGRPCEGFRCRLRRWVRTP